MCTWESILPIVALRSLPGIAAIEEQLHQQLLSSQFIGVALFNNAPTASQGKIRYAYWNVLLGLLVLWEAS